MKIEGLLLLQNTKKLSSWGLQGCTNWWNTIQEDRVVDRGAEAAEAMMLRGQSEAGDQGATIASPCHHTRLLISQLQ